jgi:uncharacterized LabA/DUF88 family protein
MDKENQRLAVLIDAENAQLAILPELMAEIAKKGSATVKRVYGDFTSQALASWREQLLAHSIQPIQQFRNTTGKNASDSALIIDAMDLLHSGRFEGFCIISSDSDFTRLASRIREEGLPVYGFGERKTPTSFVAACDKFTYTEILRKNGEKPKLPEQETVDAIGKKSVIGQHLVDAVESCADAEGWANLGHVGQVVLNHVPDFDPRNFGYKNLSSLVEASGLLNVKRQGEEGGPAAVLVRIRAGTGAN